MALNKIGKGRFTGGTAVVSNESGGLDDVLKKLVMRRERYQTPAAGGTNVLAQKAADFDVATGFTHPDVARNVEVVFSADWDGGNIEVTGVCADGIERTETIVAAAGTTVAGEVPFIVFTQMANTGTRTLGTIDVRLASAATTVLGVCAKNISDFVKLTVDGATDAVAAEDTELGTFQPTTNPNAARCYEVWYLTEEVDDRAANEP